MSKFEGLVIIHIKQHMKDFLVVDFLISEEGLGFCLSTEDTVSLLLRS